MRKNKIWKLVVSFVIAISLWVYVVSVVSPGSVKTYYNVSVNKQNLTGLSEDFIITEYDDSVDVRLEGNRIDLNALDTDDIVIEADLSGIQKAGTHHIDYTVNPTGNFASNAFVYKSSSPERLTVKVERKLSKTLLVDVVVTGELPEGFEYDPDQIAASPKEIVVSGPESMITNMEYAVVTVDLNDVKNTIDQEYEYILCDADKQIVETNKELVHPETDDLIRVIIPIYSQKELPLGVNLIPGGGIQAENCKVTFSPIEKLDVYGTPEAINAMKELVLGDIELSKIDFQETSYEQTFTLDMSKYQDIYLFEGYEPPEQITVTVELINVETKELEIPTSQIKVTGAQDMDCNIQKDSLTLKFRGDATQIQQLTASDVTVTLDLTDKNVGQQNITAKVTLKEGFTNVAVWGKYQVDVDLAKKR